MAERRKSRTKFIVLLAIGFEFVGLVLGGSFAGYLVGKTAGLQRGVGEAFGTMAGLIAALIVTYRMLRIFQRL